MAVDEGGRVSVVDRFPAKHLDAPVVRALPEPPDTRWRMIGPGVIAAGVGLASGEFILYPYIASQVGWFSCGPRWSGCSPSTS